MTRLTAKDFPKELLELYDFYAHGRITKREFLDRAAKFAVGGVTAAALLSTLSPDYALQDGGAAGAGCEQKQVQTCTPIAGSSHTRLLGRAQSGTLPHRGS